MSWELILPYFPQIRHWIMDPNVSDVMVNGDGSAYADVGGKLLRIPLVDPIDQEALQGGIENIARILGRDITEKNPILDARLPDGSRVAAMRPPASVGGWMLTIRKFIKWFSMEELVEMETVPKNVAGLLQNIVNQRKNILISGGTGSGKTTLMRAVLDYVLDQERLVVIEKPAELKLHHHAARCEATDPTEGNPGISVSQLVEASLRHRPDRIVIGEIRDESAYQLLQAMNTGHNGTISTIHADSAEQALYRISGLALGAKPNLNHAFVFHETANAINYVLHIQRCDGGERRVTEFVRVGRLSPDNRFVTTSLF